LYIQDRHSAEARERVKQVPRLWFTPLLYAECSHAIGKQVFFGKMSLADADATFDLLAKDRADGLWLDSPMPEVAFELCADLGRQYAPRIGVRTSDTLHVACALELKTERFWTFDERQAKLAKAQGMKVT
jgi:predicted nucleic acid-binding protein